MRLIKFMAAWAFMFVVWMLLTFTLDIQLIVSGFTVSAVGAYLFSTVFIKGSGKDLLNPKRWAYLVLYVPIFVKGSVLASLDIAWRVVHPKMPIRPGIVRVPTHLRKDWEITLLSNSITLTPGTLLVDFDQKRNELYVHWIHVTKREVEAVRKEIFGAYEPHLRKMFE